MRGIGDNVTRFLYVFGLFLLFTFSCSHEVKAQKDVSDARKFLEAGDQYFSNCQYIKALDIYSAGIAIAREGDSLTLLGELITSAGIVYDYLGDYATALDYYESAYRIMDKMDNDPWKAAILNNIGAIYSQWNKPETALKFYFHSLAIEKEIGNAGGIAESYQNIGIAYRSMDMSDSSMSYYKASLSLAMQLNDSIMISTSYDNIGNLYLDRKDAASATEWFQKALSIQTSIRDDLGIVFSMNNLGLVSMMTSDYAAALRYFSESQKIARRIGLNKEALFASEKLVEIAEKNGNISDAYAYLKEVLVLRDSLFNEMSTRKLSEMEARYELSRKNREIEIGKVQIEQQNEIIRRERLIKYLIASGLLVSLLLTAGLVWLYRQKRRSYQVLLLQNIELAMQEKILVEHQLVSPRVYAAAEDDVDLHAEKYQKSSLTDDQKNVINTKIIELMEKEHRYLKADLTIEDLAIEAGTNRRYLSQVINEIHHTNYNTFVNTYRVKEARKLLLDPANSHFSLEGIAAKAGFNSRISFNNAFKKITGLTPAYFQKSHMQS